MNNQELYQIAFNAIHHIKLKFWGTAGHVACALETCNGNIFTGICIDLPCSIGLCAEQAAIAEMVKNKETAIKKIIAVFEDGSILPPCGRCREFIAQIDDRNILTQIVMPEMRDMMLQDLLPERWDNKWDCKK
jgi:cytidine deaminase